MMMQYMNGDFVRVYVLSDKSLCINKEIDVELDGCFFQHC